MDGAGDRERPKLNLGLFVEKFVGLVRGLEELGFTCLKVYALNSGRMITKEADLPPSELEDFKGAFDPNQPRLCRETLSRLERCQQAAAGNIVVTDVRMQECPS